MDGCVGRVEELAYLNALWDKVPISCAVCGRRHLGKTALLREFTRDKDHIYITGTEGLRSDNLKEINLALSRFSGTDTSISDIDELFPTIRRLCARRKVVVVIDRLADLAENFEEINPYIRNFMTREMGGTRILLLVCDSDNSVFGRFYYNLELKPMSYIDCKGFHPGYTALQHLKVYAIVGGTPAYHHLFRSQDPDEVVRTQIFDHMSVFSLEVEGLVSTEMATTGNCSKILAAIADGAESIRDMASRSGISASFCSKMVEDMEHKGILRKEVSSGISRRAVYAINSNLIRFYYQVVYRYTHVVEFESPESAYDFAKQDIDAYMEREFKAICMDHVTRSFEYRFVGKLRRRDDTVDEVIDFLASVNEGGAQRMLVARCRLYGEPMGRRELDELVQRASAVDGPGKMYHLFSGSGFTSELRGVAEGDPDVRLISLDDVYEG